MKKEKEKEKEEQMPVATSFPTSFPEASIQTLILTLEGKNGDKWNAAEAVYDVLGFTLHAIRTGTSTQKMTFAGVPTDKMAVEELRNWINGPKIKSGAMATPTPANVPSWLIPLLLNLLSKLLVT